MRAFSDSYTTTKIAAYSIILIGPIPKFLYKYFEIIAITRNSNAFQNNKFVKHRSYRIPNRKILMINFFFSFLKKGQKKKILITVHNGVKRDKSPSK